MAEKQIKVGEHILVPKHEIISQEEAEKLLQSYNVSRKQLPKISKKDPAIKDVDPKPGDIVKITRNSPTTKTAIFYRVVTSG
ncbi:MAG: DNA-directed RNA polymerase subunit H [Candidatus Nanoarchaeia archaeon]|nr:DNA-directed RNA polymerase subunit H [Candidatus Nanoarchaeia archaeon]